MAQARNSYFTSVFTKEDYISISRAMESLHTPRSSVQNLQCGWSVWGSLCYSFRCIQWSRQHPQQNVEGSCSMNADPLTKLSIYLCTQGHSPWIGPIQISLRYLTRETNYYSIRQALFPKLWSAWSTVGSVNFFNDPSKLNPAQPSMGCAMGTPVKPSYWKLFVAGLTP